MVDIDRLGPDRAHTRGASRRGRLAHAAGQGDDFARAQGRAVGDTIEACQFIRLEADPGCHIGHGIAAPGNDNLIAGIGDDAAAVFLRTWGCDHPHGVGRVECARKIAPQVEIIAGHKRGQCAGGQQHAHSGPRHALIWAGGFAGSPVLHLLNPLLVWRAERAHAVIACVQRGGSLVVHLLRTVCARCPHALILCPSPPSGARSAHCATLRSPILLPCGVP